MSKQPVTVEDKVICPKIPSASMRFGKLKTNYVTPEMGVLAASIRKGSRVKLRAGRRRVVGDKIVEKTEGPGRSVLVVQDYRFPAQFDNSGFHANPEQRPYCLPLTAPATARFARTIDKKSAVSSFRVTKL